MTEETQHLQVLRTIYETKAFDKLHPYSDPKLWASMSADERKLLAKLFVHALENEHENERPYLQMATQLDPNNADLWHRRGMVLMSHSSPQILEEASLCFEKAVFLDETCFDAWHAWAGVSMHRAMIAEDVDHCLQAKEKFQKAHALIKEVDETMATFFWHYGLMWYTLGRFSGEASDYHDALLLFRKAKSLGLNARDFHQDFANILVALGELINSIDMLQEAIEHYKLSLDIGEESWETKEEIATRSLSYGRALQLLFEKTHDTIYFQEARSLFQNALLHQPEANEARFSWGTLELFAAKLWQSVEALEQGIEKFSTLETMQPESAPVISHLAECYSLQGYHEDSLDTLQYADELAKKAIQIAPLLPHSWLAASLASYQLGRYFFEPKYFQQACDYAAEGLRLQLDNGQLWHILAVAKFSIAEMNEDLLLLEEALTSFQKASQSDLVRMGCLWNDWGITLLTMAELTQEIKYIQEAIEKFEIALLRQEPMNIEWLVHYASAFEQYGDMTDGEEAYEKAIQILMHVTNTDPENVTAKYQLATCWCSLGEIRSDLTAYQKAIVELQSVVQMEPEDDMARCDLGLACLHVAASTRDLALFEQAEQHFLQASALGNQIVYYHLACLYTLQNNFPDAIHFLEKAFECQLLPTLEDMMEDEWLAPLLSTVHFQNFIKRLTTSS